MSKVGQNHGFKTINGISSWIHHAGAKKFLVFKSNGKEPASYTSFSTLGNAKARLKSIQSPINKNPARAHAKKRLKNPALDYGDEATASELASHLRWVDPAGKLLHDHLLKTSKKSNFSAVKYAEFLAKAHFPKAAAGYYGSASDAKRYATMPVRKRAGELFVENVLDRSYDE